MTTSDARKRNAERTPTPSGSTFNDWLATVYGWTDGDFCICAACQPNYRLMRVCGTCGHKRCPGAADHRNTCTGSNEPGQPGSLYADPPTYQEPDMTAKTRHDELVALLTEIRDRLPEPEQPRAQVGVPTSNPVKVTVSQPDFSHVNESIRRVFTRVGKPTPEHAPGEPVEPREDEDPDEALAKVAFGEYMLSPSWDEAEPDMRKAWLDVARAAREHIEAEQEDDR